MKKETAFLRNGLILAGTIIFLLIIGAFIAKSFI